jgi:hypothetical protein
MKDNHRIIPANADNNHVAGIPLLTILALKLIHPKLLERVLESPIKESLTKLWDVENEKRDHHNELACAVKKAWNWVCVSAVLVLWLLVHGYFVLYLVGEHTSSGFKNIMMYALLILGVSVSLVLVRISRAMHNIYKLTKLREGSEAASMLRELDKFAITTWERHYKFRRDFKAVEGKPEDALTVMDVKQYQGIIGLSAMVPGQIEQYFRLGLDLIVYEIVSELARDRMCDVSALREELKQADLLLCDFGLVDIATVPGKRWDEMFKRMEAHYERNHPKGIPEPTAIA